MNYLIIRTIKFLTVSLILMIFQGCSQFETPLEIPESGSIQVLTTSDAKCTLYLSEKPVMEWTGSKIIPGLVSGSFKVKIASEKFNSSFEESFHLGISQRKDLDIGSGILDIKIKSNLVWELTKNDKLILAGEGSFKIDTLWPGDYRVKVSVPGEVSLFLRDISITKSQTYLLEMEYGSLDVRIPSTMDAFLLNSTIELARWNGSKVIDSLWVGFYKIKVKVNPLFAEYEKILTIEKQQTKVIEPHFGSFIIKTKSDWVNALFLEGEEQFSWTGSKEFNPWLAGNYVLKTRMFPDAASIAKSFIIVENAYKTIEWDYGKISIDAYSTSFCKLKRESINQLIWQGNKTIDSIIIGNYSIEIQEASNHPIWFESFVLSKDEQKNIIVPYASLEITTNVGESVAKLIFDGNTIKTLTGSGTISAIVPGQYILTIMASGYTIQTEIITLLESQTFQKIVTLVQIPPFTPMISVPAGQFVMGCTSEQGSCYADEFPTHQVTLSAYEIGKYEITQKEWRTVMGSSPSYHIGDNKPVEYVSWYEMINFCNILSTIEGLTPVYTNIDSTVTANWSANGYRLPTEAEWEYAARGGELSTNTTYSGGNIMEDVGWYYSNSNSGSTTQEVGKKSPNQLGLYDMSGNVWEMCWDRYGNYSSSNQTNPKGANSGSYRVSRGGGIHSSSLDCRVSPRANPGPNVRGSTMGFRLARTK